MANMFTTGVARHSMAKPDPVAQILRMSALAPAHTPAGLVPVQMVYTPYGWTVLGYGRPDAWATVLPTKHPTLAPTTRHDDA